MKLHGLVILFGLGVAYPNTAAWAQPQDTMLPPDTASAAKAPENWFNLDRQQNQVTGVSTEKAYELLKGKPSRTVVVGVIDSGVDVAHEDLKDNIWTNEDEVPGNGKDDDKNGYADDVHGWNFIGGKDGKNVNQDTYELTREYVRLKEKFEESKKAKKHRRKEKEQYAYYQTIKAEYDEKVNELKQQAAGFKSFHEIYQPAKELVKKQLGKDDITLEDLEKLSATDEATNKARAVLQYAYSNGLTDAAVKEAADYFKQSLEYGYNTEFDPRRIVGDKYDNLSDRNYGNNDVTGPDARHGTHVAGIIAAGRSNNVGITGIADNAKIMVIRAVPDGDERDKDIANAIRYAVDNGAQIVNMSFGKSYSPDKKAVDEAVEYAASKGVLLVHAAGNDAKDVDVEKNFPNRKLDDGKSQATNWIEVGASSWGDSTNFVGTFSNYGKQSVDVFAPGVDIYSTTPKQHYENLSGTSMAAPVTSGVAALLLSYFPDLTANQVRDIIIKSTVKFTDTPVNKPGTGGQEGEPTMVNFGDLSITGGVVNAYEAVKMAESMSGQSK